MSEVKQWHRDAAERLVADMYVAEESDEDNVAVIIAAHDPTGPALEAAEKALELLSVDPPLSETPTIESIVDWMQTKARAALAAIREARR